MAAMKSSHLDNNLQYVRNLRDVFSTAAVSDCGPSSEQFWVSVQCSWLGDFWPGLQGSLVLIVVFGLSECLGGEILSCNLGHLS